MERGIDIRTEEGDTMMSNSMQLNHPLESSLTIETTDNEQETRESLTSDSHNPRNTPFSGSHSSKPIIRIGPLFSHGKSAFKKWFGPLYRVSVPNFPDYNFDTIEHDWSTISHSDASNADNSDYDDLGAHDSDDNDIGADSWDDDDSGADNSNASQSYGDNLGSVSNNSDQTIVWQLLPNISKNDETEEENHSKSNNSDRTIVWRPLPIISKNDETEKEKCSNNSNQIIVWRPLPNISKNDETKEEKRCYNSDQTIIWQPLPNISKNDGTEDEKRSYNSDQTIAWQLLPNISKKNGDQISEENFNHSGKTWKGKRSKNNKLTPHPGVKLSYNSDQIREEKHFNDRDKTGKGKRSTNNELTPHPGPEKKLTDFALQIVIMEKTASGIGLLAFIWATVVLLGGFASELKMIDFGFISTITFMVGTGLLNDQNQLDSRFFFQATKVISSTIGRNLTILQFLFASICIALSVLRLVKHYYSDQFSTTNMKMALYIFYTMALVYGVLFQLKKAYWLWKVSYSKIMQEVCKECGLNMSGVLLMKRFFYETYWKLSKGSVFSALNLDFITFAQGLIISNSQNDQLIAVRILNETYSEETCQRLETSTETIGRLFKMLTCKGNGSIQIIAARIVERLACGLLIEDIPGGMDCIHSLLTVPKTPKDFNAKTLELNLLGLNILKKLANKPKNCLKIKETHGLLLMIVEFLDYKNGCIHHPNVQLVNGCIPVLDVQLKIFKRSLALLTRIISIEGETGKMLRRDIFKISFTVSNLRNILIKEGNNNPKVFRLVAESLTALSMDMDAKEKIGRTFGIINVLFSIFVNLSMTSNECKLRLKAGGALAMLLLQSMENCSELLCGQKDVVEKLTSILVLENVVDSNNGISYRNINRELQKKRISEGRVTVMYKIMAMKILRNLFAYTDVSEWWNQKQLNVVPWVLKTIMTAKNNKLLEALRNFMQ